MVETGPLQQFRLGPAVVVEQLHGRQFLSRVNGPASAVVAGCDEVRL
ncbi:hypothetical protein [Streptomyces broussonetiae]|uniref:Uncharacterized protein n=1 Tax=Streptomyces broussonetiae TaxID=2686304 RepID=A0ABV5EDE1_9ACTN